MIDTYARYECVGTPRIGALISWFRAVIVMRATSHEAQPRAMGARRIQASGKWSSGSQRKPASVVLAGVYSRPTQPV